MDCKPKFRDVFVFLAQGQIRGLCRAFLAFFSMLCIIHIDILTRGGQIMLEESIAQKLIDRFSGTTEHNINIMNSAGVIIASRDHSRIGRFHETAYRMLSQGRDCVEVNEGEQFLGTQPGINMTLENKGTPVGVVGITGDPEQVRPLALLLKAAVEGMLEFELQQKAILQRHSSKDRFFQHLLYFDLPDTQELTMQARELGYLPDCIRIPILISVAQEGFRDAMADVCKQSELHTSQDMLIRTTDLQTIVFLHLKPSFSAAREYRELVELYLTPAMRFAREKQLDCSFCVGTIQSELRQYHVAYHHCCWMQKSLPAQEGPIYFYDHVVSYLLSRIPLTEFQGIFGAYVEQEPDKFWEKYRMLIGTMSRNNNNMVQSANQLHMHKNTLVYHYNQIREELHLNPMARSEDEQMAAYLCYYLDQRSDR